MQGLDPDPLSLIYSCVVTRTMGWARGSVEWATDPDPHFHGDTNIHYKIVVIRMYAPCTRVGTITGLDYWTGLLDSPELQNTTRSVQNRS